MNQLTQDIKKIPKSDQVVKVNSKKFDEKLPSKNLVKVCHQLALRSQAICVVVSYLTQEKKMLIQQACQHFYQKIVPLSMSDLTQPRFYQPMYFEDNNFLYFLDTCDLITQGQDQLNSKARVSSHYKSEKNGDANNQADADDAERLIKKKVKWVKIGEIQGLRKVFINNVSYSAFVYRSLCITPQKRLFLIGGIKRQDDYQSEQKVPITETVEVKIDFGRHKKIPRAVVKSSMINPRCTQSMTSILNGKYIAVAAGALEDKKQTDTCEYYDTEKDIWHPLPKLNFEKFQASLVNVADKYLYYLGGQSLHVNSNKFTSTIERLNFLKWSAQNLIYFSQNDDPTQSGFIQDVIGEQRWEVLEVRCPDRFTLGFTFSLGFYRRAIRRDYYNGLNSGKIVECDLEWKDGKLTFAANDQDVYSKMLSDYPGIVKGSLEDQGPALYSEDDYDLRCPSGLRNSRLYDERIYVLGGLGQNFRQIHFLDLFKKEYVSSGIIEENPNDVDYILDDNYCIFDYGRRIMSIGKFHIIEIEIGEKPKVVTYPDGYKKIQHDSIKQENEIE
eukprot:403342081